MNVPKTVSVSELREEARNSPLRKVMIVRCLPMGGSWSGFTGAEFYVLSDEAEPMWGHSMAVRHYYDVDPDAARMFTSAKDKDGKYLFSYTSLPASCVQVLEQNNWTEKDANVFLCAHKWKESWEAQHRRDVEAYERRKARWEESGDKEHERWMNIFARHGRPKIWAAVRENHNGVFTPNMLEVWVEEENE